jgi:iron complex outermembrane recepter protein
MSLKKTITLLLVVFCIQSAHSQRNNCTETLSGKILLSSGGPAVGAAVFLLKSGQGVTTDAEGAFTFEHLCPEEKIRVSLLGFKELVQPVTANQVELVLEADVRELDEVVVEGELAETEHAHNLATLNEQQLAETAGKSLGESLREIAGVNSIQSGPGIFKPVIHGVHSQRILILNHGIRQEGQQWGAEHAPEIDPFIASDITVIKDASSIKYGTDALGGVIVVNPPELPHDNTLGGSLHTVLQSNGRSGTLSGMLEGGFKKLEGWGWRVQGTAKRAGDYHTPDYSLTNTGVKELNVSGAIGYHNETKGIELFVSRFSSELGILKGTSIGSMEDLKNAMEREPPQHTSSFSYDIGEPRQDVNHNLVKLNGHINTNYGIIRMQYGFQNNNRKEFDIRKGANSSKPAIDLQLNTHTLESEWERSFSETQTLCLGVTGMYQQNYNIFGTDRIPFIPNFTNMSGGVYSVWKAQLKKWNIDAGARYDYRDYTVRGFDSNNNYYRDAYSFHNASASLGGTLSINSVSSFSTNLSAAWRPPHVAELYSVGTHQSAAAIENGLLLRKDAGGIVDFANANVKSEQAVKWVNTYAIERPHYSFSVTGYVNYILNYIFLKPVGIEETLRGTLPALDYHQTDALFVGGDVSSEVTLLPKVVWTGKVSLLRASDERNDDYLLYIPPSRLESALRISFKEVSKIKNAYIEPKIKYVTRQSRAPRVIAPDKFLEAVKNDTDPLQGDDSNFDFMETPDAYALLNLSAGLTIASGKVQYNVRASVENLTNTSYREYSNRFRYYSDDIGRNFILSLKCIF